MDADQVRCPRCGWAGANAEAMQVAAHSGDGILICPACARAPVCRGDVPLADTAAAQARQVAALTTQEV